jgi:SAM-dependent methyltransferase
MTSPTLAPPAAPSIFFAPSSDEHIEAALDLAQVRAGDRFLDLGCGDGRVLVAAARRGAKVRGVEIDEALAGQARERLATAGLAGEVEVRDMFRADIEADVVYAYLSPAVLARLRPTFATGSPGTRLVTPRYPIAGWLHEGSHGGCHSYTLPPRREAAPEKPGWRYRGMVAVLPARRRCLLPLMFSARAGQVDVRLEGPLGRAALATPGADYVQATTERVPIDFIFKGRDLGSVVAGPALVQGEEITIAVVFGREGFGEWGFGPDEGSQFREMLARKTAEARLPLNQGAPA